MGGALRSPLMYPRAEIRAEFDKTMRNKTSSVLMTAEALILMRLILTCHPRHDALPREYHRHLATHTRPPILRLGERMPIIVQAAHPANLHLRELPTRLAPSRSSYLVSRRIQQEHSDRLMKVSSNPIYCWIQEKAPARELFRVLFSCTLFYLGANFLTERFSCIYCVMQ